MRLNQLNACSGPRQHSCTLFRP